MNRPSTVIGYVNAAHFIVHYAMLIFPAALIFLGPALGLGFGQLLPYATPGFVAFGAGSLATGWLGDRWSRRHMMVVFFVGIGLSMIAVGLASTPLQLGAALLAVGVFASIYHPVGTAMIVAYAGRLGREIGINGVFGNLGVALSAMATGALGEFIGWRAAFVLPGALTVALGVMFAFAVTREDRSAHRAATSKARVSRNDMWRVLVALFLAVMASSTAFNAVTVALPKLFAERLSGLTTSPATLGAITAGVYVFGALAQYTIGGLIDRFGLRWVFLPVSLVLAPSLYVAAGASGPALVVVSIFVIVAGFGQVTINDAIVGKYTTDRWRSRAYSVRYFLGFTAAGVSVALVAALHDRGGFTLVLQALAALTALVIVAGAMFPAERAEEETAAQPAE
jgi:MFS family permease